MTDHLMHPVPRSLIGKMGETVRLERFLGTRTEGGYSERQYDDPEQIDVLLRPGDIDVPFTTTEGDHGTHDLWCLAYHDDDLDEKDRLTRLAGHGYGERGYGEGHLGVGDTYEVSLPKYDHVHNMALYQLDEADSRRG